MMTMYFGHATSVARRYAGALWALFVLGTLLCWCPTQCRAQARMEGSNWQYVFEPTPAGEVHVLVEGTYRVVDGPPDSGILRVELRVNGSAVQVQDFFISTDTIVSLEWTYELPRGLNAVEFLGYGIVDGVSQFPFWDDTASMFGPD